MVEQEGHGVSEDLAHQPALQVPQTARPHPLYGVTSRELRKNGVYPVPKTAPQRAPFWSGISLLDGPSCRGLDSSGGHGVVRADTVGQDAIRDEPRDGI
jgi:hypothetical protein